MWSGSRVFPRVSLVRPFLLASALVVLVGVVLTGLWLNRQIETIVVNRTARMASVYFDSIVAGRLDQFFRTGAVGGDTRQALDQIFVSGPLAKRVVRFKLWSPGGHILYSSDASQIGRQYPLHEHHAYALMGEMRAAISSLDGPDNEQDRALWSQLIEIYVPLRAPEGGGVRGVAEFYHSMDNIEAEILGAQQQSWVAIAVGALIAYVSLFLLVRRAGRTIRRQRSALQWQLGRLQRLLDVNRAMRRRLQQAGSQTALMNELAMRRVAADLHDGPAQDLALVLLRLDERCGACSTTPRDESSVLRACLQRAMGSLRDIAAGLVVPGVGAMSLTETIRRAVRDMSDKAQVALEADVDAQLPAAADAVKVTAYRVIQEGLANALRHATGHLPRLTASLEHGQVEICITDDGPGFDPDDIGLPGHLGLAFLRERIQLVGGELYILSAPGAGTTLRARLPLTPQEVDLG